ncbi:MAG: DsbA family protein, partial [Alphaproteobacteria bacterium]|nr:DsbA family protein [Alphaproteobacteria bacterium]
ILSPTSHLAAQWALAAQRQDKYFEFHQKLMDGGVAINEDNMVKVATDLGLDVEQMKKDVTDPKINEAIATNIKISQELGIRGTPAFVINDRLIGGYIELEEMKKVIEEIRSAQASE